jgi:hypothetical protein
MTIPYERTQAILRTRQLLQDLADGTRVEPDLLQRRAAALLKHYRDVSHVALSARLLPDTWADPQAKWYE